MYIQCTTCKHANFEKERCMLDYEMCSSVFCKGYEKTDAEKANDAVEHPNHYNRDGAIECFDEFVAIYGVEAAKHACLFNIHKYRYRAADKNGVEDLKKSDWYMRKYLELSNININADDDISFIEKCMR